MIDSIDSIRFDFLCLPKRLKSSISNSNYIVCVLGMMMDGQTLTNQATKRHSYSSEQSKHLTFTSTPSIPCIQDQHSAHHSAFSLSCRLSKASNSKQHIKHPSIVISFFYSALIFIHPSSYTTYHLPRSNRHTSTLPYRRQ